MVEGRLAGGGGVGGGGGGTAFGRGDAVTREDRQGREGGDEGGDMGSGGVGDSRAKRSRDPQQPPGESSRSWEPQSMREEKHVRIDERGGYLMRPARIDTLPAHCVPGFRRLFIGGLKENTSEDALRKYAQQFGEVTDVTMVTRFGLVTFAYRHDAEKALRSNRTYTSIAKSRVRYLLHSLDYLMCCLVLCCIIRVVPS